MSKLSNFDRKILNVILDLTRSFESNDLKGRICAAIFLPTGVPTKEDITRGLELAKRFGWDVSN